MDITDDEQGRPCLVLDVPLRPASAHDALAMEAAVVRMCDATPHSPEWKAALDEILAIRKRGI